MKLTIVATEHLVFLDGVHCRVWEGTTENGNRVAVFVHRVVAADRGAVEECDRELLATLNPSMMKQDER